MRPAAVEHAAVVPFAANRVFEILGLRAVGVDGHGHVVRQKLHFDGRCYLGVEVGERA